MSRKHLLSWPLTISGAAAIILALSGCAAGNSLTTGSPTATPAATPATSVPASTSSSTKTVEYKVEGTGQASSISWLTINNGQSSQEQATNAPLPWTKTITVPQDQWVNFGSFTLTAQNGATSGPIHATITVDGKTVADQTSTGQYAVVTANATS